MKNKFKVCNNPDCSISTGTCKKLTFGSGRLDDYGYWEHPCYECARAWEKLQSEKYHGDCQPAWPMMTPKDFLKLCSKTDSLTLLIARIGSELIGSSDSKIEICVGYALLARRGLILYKEVNEHCDLKRFIEMVDHAFNERGWFITSLPGEGSYHVA